VYQFRTMNGAVYEVENGRITRQSDAPILNSESLAVERRTFRFHRAPMVGEQFRFVLKDGNVPIITGFVTEIIRPSTRTQTYDERYCQRHDLFNCWMCAS
jgi:hypothetical protein